MQVHPMTGTATRLSGRAATAWNVLRGLATSLLALGMLAGAQAQGSYPNKPVQMVIPYPPGGPVDLVARAFAQALDGKLNQRVVGMARDGGSTTVGMNAVLQAPADGYTLYYGPVTSLTVHLHWMKGLQFKMDSFTPVCQTFENAFYLVTRPDSRYTSLAQVLAQGKANPGSLSYGHPGVSSSPHLAGAELFQKAGVSARDVPFRGEPPMLPTLMSGEMDLAVVTTAFMKTQNLRPLAVFAFKRVAEFPNVPTVHELGFPVNPSGYGGLMVRAETPPDVVARIEKACREAVADPAFREFAQRYYQQTDFLDQKAFKARIQADHQSKGELLRTVNLDR